MEQTISEITHLFTRSRLRWLRKPIKSLWWSKSRLEWNMKSWWVQNVEAQRLLAFLIYPCWPDPDCIVQLFWPISMHFFWFVVKFWDSFENSKQKKNICCTNERTFLVWMHPKVHIFTLCLSEYICFLLWGGSPKHSSLHPTPLWVDHITIQAFHNMSVCACVNF